MTTQFQSNPANLKKILDSAVKKTLERRGEQALAAAKAEFPPGALRDSLRYAVVTGSGYQNSSARIGSNEEELLFEEKGTRPHTIRPRNKALKFPGSGSYQGITVFAKVVHHPGSVGKHKMKNVLRKVIGRAG